MSNTEAYQFLKPGGIGYLPSLYRRTPGEALDISGLKMIVEAVELGENGMLAGERKTYPGGGLYSLESKENLRELWWLQQLIPALYTREMARRGRSSYGLKHFLARFIHPHSYVSNSSTILMLLYLGFPMNYYRDDLMNMNIRAKPREGDDLFKGIQEYLAFIAKHKNPYE